ncbi:MULTISPECIES: DUF2742 domain-containing protein [unclassified Streptomyces]|uniref:DUF2742 domain-containing protein n=1 Tax=unclassified Streptomyces TaxID=2593676 RepID=UPI0038054331
MTSTDAMTLWASARVTELLDGQNGIPPTYGTAEWQRLAANDPRKAAAILTAAEMWRRFGDEEALLDWFREASRSRHRLAEGKTLAELDALAKPKPPRLVQATVGWPPVAIPGRPGWYQHLIDGQQVELPRGGSEGAA